MTSLEPIRDVSQSRAKKFWKGYSPLLYPPLHNALSSARTLLRNYLQQEKKIIVFKDTECSFSYSEKCTIAFPYATCFDFYAKFF